MREYRVLISSTNKSLAADASRAVIVLTTIGAGADAAALARTLVEERLAACVNIVPGLTSVYRWQGVIEQDAEQQLVVKTTADRVAALEARLGALHPYDLPEFLVLEVGGGGAAYLAWLRQAVAGDD